MHWCGPYFMAGGKVIKIQEKKKERRKSNWTRGNNDGGCNTLAYHNPMFYMTNKVQHTKPKTL